MSHNSRIILTPSKYGMYLDPIKYALLMLLLDLVVMC